MTSPFVAQWLVASSLLNISTQKSAVEQYLNLDGPNGVYFKPRGVCRANANGIILTYVRVYKTGNSMICTLMKKFQPGPRRHALAFTFVRDPLEHFVSGFTEIVHRSKTNPSYTQEQYQFMRNLADPSATAKAFIRDFVGQQLNQNRDVTDAHSFPQVAFLRNYLPSKLHFMGTLRAEGGFEKSFRTLSSLINYTIFPGTNGQHPKTSSTSGNKYRLAMNSLLFSMNEFKEAMCRTLLIDYICLNFTLPDDCAEALGRPYVLCPPQMSARVLRSE